MEDNKRVNKKVDYINRIFAVIIILSFCIVFAQRTFRHSRDILGSVGDSIGRFSKSEDRLSQRSFNLYMDIYGNLRGGITYFFSYPPRELLFTHAHFEYLKLTGRGHFNDITFLKDGRHMLDRMKYKTYFDERANSILGLNNYLADKGTPFLYVRVPNKLHDNSLLPAAYSDNRMIENGNTLLGLVSDAGVDTYDIRAEMMRENFDFVTGFYRRHMHWTNKTVLWASQKVGGLMNREYGFNIDLGIWDLDKYEQVTYEKVLLGNEAFPVGAYYDLETITLLYPAFPVELDKADSNHNFHIDSSNNFVELFLPNIYRGDLTHFECHDIRIPGAHFTHLVNHEATEDKRILLISDSYSLSWAMYLPMGIKNLDFVYLINYRTPAEIWDFIEDKHYDLAILAVSDVVVSTENAAYFEADRLNLGIPPQR